jgi:hypothetical protein
MDPLGAFGVLPRAAFGADIRVERSFTPTWSLRLGVVGLAALDVALDGGTFDAWLLAPRVDVCAALELSRALTARGCMGALVGGLYAKGSGYAQTLGTMVRWLAAANSLDLAIDLGANWSLDLSATLILPLVNTSIIVKSFPVNNAAGATGQVGPGSNLAAAAPGGAFGAGPVYRF